MPNQFVHFKLGTTVRWARQVKLRQMIIAPYTEIDGLTRQGFTDQRIMRDNNEECECLATTVLQPNTHSNHFTELVILLVRPKCQNDILCSHFVIRVDTWSYMTTVYMSRGDCGWWGLYTRASAVYNSSIPLKLIYSKVVVSSYIRCSFRVETWTLKVEETWTLKVEETWTLKVEEISCSAVAELLVGDRVVLHTSCNYFVDLANSY